MRILQSRSLVPVSLKVVTPHKQAAKKAFSRPASIQDRMLVLKQLALLLNAGVPLVQAVGTLKEQNIHPQLSAAFVDIERRLRGGTPFVEALSAGLPTLPQYVFQLAAAGEAIGRMGNALGDAARQMEYDHQVRVNIRNALTYPTILVVTGVAAVLFIFIVVVPRFATMLATAKAPLPFISVLVIRTGTFLNAHLGTFATLAAVTAATIFWLSRDPAIRLKFRESLASAPLLGRWLQESDLASWSSMLGTMLANGVDLIKALQLARDSVTLPGLAQRLDQALKLVRGGQPLSAALASQSVFNDTAVSLVQVGEESGELPAMLQSLATLYEDIGRQRMKRFLLMLEPAAILFIGGVIGTIVAAIMLAITSVNQIAM
jgi:general secretion pathway protein F